MARLVDISSIYSDFISLLPHNMLAEKATQNLRFVWFGAGRLAKKRAVDKPTALS